MKLKNLNFIVPETANLKFILTIKIIIMKDQKNTWSRRRFIGSSVAGIAGCNAYSRCISAANHQKATEISVWDL